MAREKIQPGKTGDITVTAFAKDGTKLSTGGRTDGAAYYTARAYAGITDEVTKRVQGRGSSPSKAKKALNDRVAKMVADAETEAENARAGGKPRDWHGFALEHRAWIESDDADYSDGSRRLYCGTIDGYFLQDAPTKADERAKPHRFAGRQLADITHGELHDWLQDIANRRGDGVAHSVRSLLGRIYRRALAYGIVSADPTARLGKVKRSRRTLERMQREATEKAQAEGKALAVPKDHTRGLSKDDIGQLFAFLESDPGAKRNGLSDIAYAMFGAGLRIGEALALQWDSLDLDSARPWITVRSTVARKPGEGLYLQPWTKTEEGMRRVPIAAALATVLADKRERNRERSKAEPDWNPLDLVFPSERGTIRDRSNTHEKFRRIFDSEAVGLAWATPHVFRRTYATSLLNRGISPVAVAALLGHTDPAFTLKTYGDWKSTPDIAGTVLDGLFTIGPITILGTKPVTEQEALMLQVKR